MSIQCSSNALEDEDVIGGSVMYTMGVVFPVLLQSIEVLVQIPICSLRSYYLRKVIRIYESNGLAHTAIIGSGTTDEKGVAIFRCFAEFRDFGTYHMLFLGVELYMCTCT